MNIKGHKGKISIEGFPERTYKSEGNVSVTCSIKKIKEIFGNISLKEEVKRQ